MMETDSNRRVNLTRRLTWALLLACSAGLLVSSVYRAATFSFTHDESLSFAGFSWDPFWSQSANNHLLNTWLMEWCSAQFGDSELSLRLPNVLAHLIYLASALAFLRRLGHPVLLVAGFVLLNLNLFLLDFFSLARGYGLALGFTMLSLYLLARAFEEKGGTRGTLKFLCLSVLSGALAVLANYSFLNYYLPLLLAGGWLLLTDASRRRFNRRGLPAAAALFAAGGLFLAFVLPDLFRLRDKGALYYGGESGFISDTVGSLARSSLYSLPDTLATEQIVSAVLVGLFFVLLIFGVCLLLLRKEVSLFELLLLLLAATVFLPALQHQLLQTRFPLDRAALYYLPLYATVILSASQLLWRLSGGRRGRVAALALPALMAAALGWHFCRGFNTQTCFTWWFDAHDDEVLEIIDRDRKVNYPGREVKLSNSWMMEPSLNFYRFTRDYAWLEPVTRQPVSDADADYVYAFESEVKEFAAAGHTKLASYADTQTVLLRVNHVGKP